VDEGTFGAAYLRLTGARGTRWSVTTEVLGGEGQTTGRAFGEIRRGFGGRRGFTLRLKSGIATAPTLRQSLFRLGGLATVRGFGYGTLTGQAFWAAQLDVAPIPGRLRPVLFLDAGQADRPEDLFGSRALLGGGIGLSVFGGLLRFDLSYPISPDTDGKLRFDISVAGVR
jgi:hemolysin activation/secretion protein